MKYQKNLHDQFAKVVKNNANSVFVTLKNNTNFMKQYEIIEQKRHKYVSFL